MNGSIITTAQAAKILGVSARTAQLWIESGVIPSWKTPGGHRRMFEPDVVAVLERGAELNSVTRRVLVLAPGKAHETWAQAFANMDVTVVGYTDNSIAAAVALGATVPDVIVIQLEELGELAPEFLSSLRSVPLLSRLQIVIATSLPTDVLTPVLGPQLRYKVMRLEPAAGLAQELAQNSYLKERKLLPLPAELLDATFPVGANEGRRLAAVYRSGILDSAPEDALDNLTQIAALSLSAPIALITILSEDRQWFKARFGLDMSETPRSWAFCNYTVLQSGIQEFSAMDTDPRFADNPAVVGPPHFRYYAGAPITDDQGAALGSLCVIDTKPRKLSATETQILARLARQVSAEIMRGTRPARGKA